MLVSIGCLLVILLCLILRVSTGWFIDKELLNSVVTMITVLVGFSTATLGVFIGIVNDRIFTRIRDRGKSDELVGLFRKSLYTGFAAIIISLIANVTIAINRPVPIFEVCDTAILLRDLFSISFVILAFLNFLYTFLLARIMLVIFKTLLNRNIES